MSLPVQKYETSNGLKIIHDTTYECLMAIENAGVSVENWDVLVIQIVTRKLNQKTILDYESNLENVKEVQNVRDFLKYVESRYLALMSAESITKSNEKNEKSEKYEKNDKKEKTLKDTPFSCSYCENKPHSVYKCSEFLKLEPKARYEWARDKKICFVCIQPHRQGECKSKFGSCKFCSKKHNYLLHYEVKKVSLIATAGESTLATTST